MEIESRYREDFKPYHPLLFSTNHPQPGSGPGFCLHSGSSSKLFFHDLHHHHPDQFSFPGSPLGPELRFQPGGFDPFDPFSSGFSSNLDYFNETKPFTASGENAAIAAAMQKFRGVLADQLNHPERSWVRTGWNPEPFNGYDITPVSFVVPDEGSCVTAEQNGCYKEANVKKSSRAASTKQCNSRKKSNSTKGQWTIEEDRLLIHLVEKHGVRKWTHIAQTLKGRIGKQCRERWHNHLRPDIKKETWSEEEDKILIQAHAEVGNKWAEIAKRLPGRTENSIKNHWNATKRRQLSRRKCRSKHPRPNSLLQNYIKSLNLDQPSKSQSLPLTEVSTDVATGPPLQVAELYDSDDEGLVPDYDFGFGHDFLEGSSIENLLDEMEAPLEVGSMMQSELKKEMDLMEMIGHVSL
ncbi:hypothetical protein NMG60_11004446 [Bertholletia excelsa]